MTADPKMNTEMKDEDLDQVTGGIKSDIDRPDDDHGDDPDAVCHCKKFPKVAPIN